MSASLIASLIAAAERKEREENKLRLIAAQGGDEREFEPTYSLLKVDFNQETRNTKIEFCEQKKYRTIERYITKNYVRYPIFSEWKIKTKIIKKSVKLTNKELEILNNHPDNLIRKFSIDIIISLKNNALFPSWLLKKISKTEFNESITNLNGMSKKMLDLNHKEIAKFSQDIIKCNNDIKVLKEILSKKEKEQKKLRIITLKIESSKKSILKSALTLGIYNYLISQKRKKKYLLKEQHNNQIISLLNKNIKYKREIIKKDKELIQVTKEKIAYYSDYIKLLERLEDILYYRKLSEITPLPTIYNNDQLFISLKTIIGMEHEKIIGCYILHNKENDKYYVGQSKDIHRRIKQHFNGTVPKNIIFAEDYYLSKFQNKENLFEVKIIQCKTKDELDKTEKELIELYDAYNSGYNGTIGNS